jgi:glycosyltransferase involved in cell wall biosynthesis
VITEPSFSILTPTLNDLPFLKRCCASIDDQQIPGIEHIVVDGGSVDGTGEWLAQHPRVVSLRHPVGGMYAALNQALERATGTWVGFLNADEQYLPGALASVLELSKRSAFVDLITGDFLVVDTDGGLICHRKEIVPRSWYIRCSYLYTFTCALFVRRDLLGPDLRFDERFRTAGDEDFVLRALRVTRAHHLDRYVAAFVDRPDRQGVGETARAETMSLRAKNPAVLKAFCPLAMAFRHAEKALAGGYATIRGLRYELFVGDDLSNRRTFVTETASSLWHRR